MSVEIKTNKYGDHIIITDDRNLIRQALPNNNNVPIVIKILSEDPDSEPENFIIKINDTEYKFTYITTKDYVIYANDICIKACPKIIDNILKGSIICIFILYKNTYYSILVKDKFKDYLTNPCGNSELGESDINCAIREAYEETGLTIKKETITKICKIKSIQFAYDTGFFNLTYAFATILKVNTVDEFNVISSFNNDEIEKVYLIESDKLLNSPANAYNITEDHLNLIRYHYIKIKKPQYFKKMQFF